LARWFPGTKALYLPTPTWGNHIPIAKDSGLEVKHYSYFDKKTVGLDFEGMKRDIKVGLFISRLLVMWPGADDDRPLLKDLRSCYTHVHTYVHPSWCPGTQLTRQNPTGVDPTEEQWKELSDICKEKKHFPFFDMVSPDPFSFLVSTVSLVARAD
jgi:aspartate aminotransferase